MISRIFTSRFIVLLMGVFLTSSALSYAFLSQPNDSNGDNNDTNNDALIDKALGLSVDGYYKEAFAILKPLADKDVTHYLFLLASNRQFRRMKTDYHAPVLVFM